MANYTHWKKLTHPDYIGSYAFQPNQEIIVTISNVKREIITGTDGKKEDCTVVRFVEKIVDGAEIKPMILNATNAKTITSIYGTPYIEQWSGKKIQLKVEKVKAFGEVVEAIRIKKCIPKIVESVICEKCSNEVQAYKNLTALAMSQYTQNKYGKVLCASCATTAKEQSEEPKTETIDPLSDEANGKGNDYEY